MDGADCQVLRPGRTVGMRSDTKNTFLRFAQIGCGRIGQSHLASIQANSDCELFGIVDLREAPRKAAQEQHGCRSCADYKDPELASNVNAVIICTPPSSHFEIASYFLRKGINVLCEKPLALRTSDAETMAKLGKAANALLMMCSKFRYVDDIIETKAILESGLLGQVLLFENSFCSRVSMRERWNSDRKIAGGGVLIDNGSHSVDIARYLLGPIVCVHAQCSEGTQDLDVEETAQIVFQSVGGTLGVIHTSWSIENPGEPYIRIQGTEGSLEVNWHGSRRRISNQDTWVDFGEGYAKEKAIQRQLANFIATVFDREEALIGVEDSIASVRTIEAAYASALEGRMIQLGD